MEEITTTITHCPICQTEWDFMYYDGVYYFQCEPCSVYFEAYHSQTLLNSLDLPEDFYESISL